MKQLEHYSQPRLEKTHIFGMITDLSVILVTYKSLEFG